ncbi:hypothetical protein MHYP_G00341040 [Metynnis hypsauchen]
MLEERGAPRRRDWRPAGPSHFTSSLAEHLKLSDAASAKTQRGTERRWLSPGVGLGYRVIPDRGSAHRAGVDQVP